MKIRSLITNSFYLGVFQVATYIVPFATLPYFSRIFSAIEFGEIMTMIALVQFGYIVAEYGHNISATKKIIDNISEPMKISKINSEVVLSKLIVVIFYSSISYIIFSDMLSVKHYFLLMLILIFQAFQPIWYFNAIEKFKEFSTIALIGKLSYIPLVYILVDSDTGMESILISLLVSQIITLALILYFYKELIRLHAVKPREVFFELKRSSLFFLGRLSTNFQYFTLTPLVNFILGANVAGSFSIADNLSKAIRGVTGAINQVLYTAVTKSQNTKLFWVVVLITTVFLAIACYFVSLFSINIIVFIFGSGYEEAFIIFNLMLVTVVLYYFNACIGYPYFSSINRLDLANKTAYIGGLSFLGQLIFLINFIDNITVFNIVHILIYSELLVISSRLYYILFRRVK
jgi:O-antigen/teichoic acid export membrane protein